MRVPSHRYGPAVAVVALLVVGTSHALADSIESLAADLAAPRPRLRVALGNAVEIDVRDCLRSAVDAANEEDLDGFVDCFTGIAKGKVRKAAAMRFVEHDVSMGLLNAQIVKTGGTKTEVAVKYRLVLSTDCFDVVSLVVMRQVQGYWRIESEKIQSYEHDSPTMCTPSRYACLGGTCGVERRP